MSSPAEEARTIARIDTGHEEPIHDSQLDYYGKKLATASGDGVVKLFDVSDPLKVRPLVDLAAHEGPAWSVAWAHPKYPGVFASCGQDKSIILWREGNQGEFIQVFRDESHKASVNAVAFGPYEYGLTLAGASSDGTVSTLTFQPGMQGAQAWRRASFPAHPGGVLCLTWAPKPQDFSQQQQQKTLDGAKIFSGGRDNAVRVWKFSAVSETWTTEAVDYGSQHHSDWVTSVSYSPLAASGAPAAEGGADEGAIASASKDGSVIIYRYD